MTDLVGQRLEVELTEIDGVPLLWAPIDGPLTVGLIFRVGRADERLPIGGVTHLVEHLALYPLGRQAKFHFNGSVDGVSTHFYVHGEQAEVAGFLTAVCEHLRELPVDRLAVERGILRSESERRDTNTVADSLRRWRYGPRTYGLAAYEEFGLLHLDAAAARSWADRHFTRENAVLWATGPLPDGLRLPLGSGTRLQPPEATSALPTVPAWYAEGRGAAAAMAILPRSTTATALSYVVERRLQERLRYELAASYSPGVTYVPRDGHHAELWLHADVVEGADETVTDELLAVLDRVADGAVDQETLAVWRSNAIPPLSEVAAIRGYVYSEALRFLLGRTPVSIEDLRAEFHATTPADVAAAAAAARSTALYRLPEGSRPKGFRLPPAPTQSIGPVRDARTFDNVRREATQEARRLRVGDRGVSLSAGGDTEHVAVAFDACAGVLAWPDGRRTLFGDDAFVLTVRPAEWRDGSDAAALIDARVPAEAVVPMPAEPDAERGAAPAPARESPGGPPREPLREWAMPVAWLLLGVLLVVGGGARGLVFPVVSGVLSFGLAARAARELAEHRRARGLRPLRELLRRGR